MSELMSLEEWEELCKTNADRHKKKEIVWVSWTLQSEEDRARALRRSAEIREGVRSYLGE
jgi:hypothetical protein